MSADVLSMPRGIHDLQEIRPARLKPTPQLGKSTQCECTHNFLALYFTALLISTQHRVEWLDA
jgi:hypothetical protein